MRCLECQAYDLLEYRFCPCCGRLLAQVACPRCGARGGRRNPECPLCGDRAGHACSAPSCAPGDLEHASARSADDTGPAQVSDAELQSEAEGAVVETRSDYVASTCDVAMIPEPGSVPASAPGDFTPDDVDSAALLEPLASVAAARHEPWPESPEEVAIPQPWWAPRQASADAGRVLAREPEPAHDGASAADGGRPIPTDAMPSTGPKRPQLAVARPAVPPRPAGTWTRPVPRQPTTRTSFLVAGLVTILVATAMLFQRAVGIPVLALWDPHPVPPVAAPAVPASNVEHRASGTTNPSPRSAAPVEQGRVVAVPNAPGPQRRSDLPKPVGARTAPPARKSPARTPANRSGRIETKAQPRPPIEPSALPSIRLAGTMPVAAAVSPTAIPPATVAAKANRQVFEQHQVDIRPAIARRVAPTYPASARTRGIQELVVVRVLVTASGEPSLVSVLRPSKLDRAFDAAAISAVRQWTFSPARRRDRAVDCWFNVGVAFRAETTTAGGDSQ